MTILGTMKIKEYNEMMAYLTRPDPKIKETPKETWNRLAENERIRQKKSNTERIGLAKGTKADTKPTPKNNKILEYINDYSIVYDGKKATKAEADAAVKRVEAREAKVWDDKPKKMSKTDEYNTYFNKKSPKYYKKVAKIPVIPPKPDMVNGHSDWSTEDWLESIDPAGWVNDKRVEVESLYEKYLELLKGGELLPNTTFEMFEANPTGYDLDLISRINKKVSDRKKREGLAALLGVNPDRI